MVTTTKLVTAEELLAMPYDGFRYELVRGELRKMAPAGRVHGKRGNRVNVSLSLYVYENDLGETYLAETGFHLETDPDHVLAPDVAFVSKEREEATPEAGGFFPGQPDLVVEVISPSDRYTEVEEKVEEWFNAGTRMVIVVNPRNRTVRVYRSLTDSDLLTEADTLDGGDVVPGWRMLVADIFS